MFTVCDGGLGGAGEGGSARPTLSVFIIALKESRSSVRSGHLHVITERPPLSWHGCSFGPESARMAWPGVGRAARQALPEDPPPAPKSYRASGLKLVSLLGGRGAAHFFSFQSAGLHLAEEKPRPLPMK